MVGDTPTGLSRIRVAAQALHKVTGADNADGRMPDARTRQRTGGHGALDIGRADTGHAPDAGRRTLTEEVDRATGARVACDILAR